jgi:two-component system response regulator GlrR
VLRVLQERSVRALGSDREEPVDFRVVAATHRDLEAAAAEGQFREDLLARLAHVVLRTQPLRVRRSLVLPLFREFAPDRALTPAGAEALLLASWPRNVRELKALAQALAATLPPEAPIGTNELAERLPEAVRLVQRRGGRPASVSSAPPPADRREELQRLLHRHQGNVTLVARELGKPRSHVYRWLRSFGLSTERFREP